MAKSNTKRSDAQSRNNASRPKQPTDFALKQHDAPSAGDVRKDLPEDGRKAVEEAAKWYLRKNNHTSENVIQSVQLFEALKKDDLVTVSESTFKQYISELANDPTSAIACRGRGRTGGYYVSNATETLAEQLEATPAMSEDDRSNQKREQHLYSPLIKWLRTQGFKASDTSGMKSNGRWGNPDVTGIERTNALGSYKEISIATIEAKVGMDQYETDFFQAVSHTRFANRAYFAFAIPEGINKVPRELRHYSERFGVGVLVVEIPDELYYSLTKDKLTIDDKKFLGELDEDAVREVFSPTPRPVPLKIQEVFLQALGIETDDALLTWPYAPHGAS